jgi:polysaccharide biosynthesis protein PslH
MKIVMLTSRFPYPLEKGDKLRAYHQLRTLAELHEVHLITIADFNVSKQEMEALRPIVASLHVLKINPLTRLISLLKALFLKTPFQIAFFYNKPAAVYIKTTIENIRPDHIYCQLVRMTPYVLGLDEPKTLDYMDAFGIGMLRRAGVVNKLLQIFYKYEAKRMIRYEREAYKHFTNHVIISEQDSKQIGLTPEKEIHVVPNGIEEKFFERHRISPRYDIAFVGNMGYIPNIEAAEFLVNSLLPLLEAGTTVILAGARPHVRVKKLASEKVKVTGWIDDIRTAYHSARIFVAPIWSGTGQQNKILEAMACGLPCITTTSVNNAIGAEKDHQIMIADDVQQMADAVNILKNNETLQQRLSIEGKHFVKQNYSWEHYSQVLSDIFAGRFNKKADAD